MHDNKMTLDDLKRLQGLPLSNKILVTQTRIMEWYMRNDGQVYVSFSGGKDSTVLLDIVRKIYPDVPAVFVDTGLEYPEIRDFVKTVPNVIWLRPEMNFRKVIETYGYPLVSKEVARDIYVARRCPNGKTADKFNPNGEYAKKYGMGWCQAKWSFLKDSDIPISNKCCNVLKKEPAKKFEKETKLKPILATMASESANRKNAWLRHGCNAFEAKHPISTPMGFWTEQDVLEYLEKYQIPYASAYGDIVKDNKGRYKTTKCERTGCIFCGFGCHLQKEPNNFQRLKITHPNLWEYCMKPWNEGGLGMKEPLEFIGVKTE